MPIQLHPRLPQSLLRPPTYQSNTWKIHILIIIYTSQSVIEMSYLGLYLGDSSKKV